MASSFSSPILAARGCIPAPEVPLRTFISGLRKLTLPFIIFDLSSHIFNVMDREVMDLLAERCTSTLEARQVKFAINAKVYVVAAGKSP